MPSASTKVAVAAGVLAAQRKRQQQNGLAPPSEPPAQQPESPVETGAETAAATKAALLAPGVAAAVTTAPGIPPALALAIAAPLGAEAAGELAERLAKGLAAFHTQRDKEAQVFVAHQLATKFPAASRDELRRAALREFAFEAQFRAKMAKRLLRDLPKALMETDNAARIAAVREILGREKRYTLMREDAMAARAIGRMERLLAERESPEGAYWKLNPHVKHHTSHCVAMGEKPWPWEAINAMGHPPVHAGCACKLLPIHAAVSAGLMSMDQLPDVEDAVARVRDIKQDPDVTADGIAEWLEESALRIPKGFAHGGEFMRRGALLSPLEKRRERVGRWAWAHGRMRHVPEADRWRRMFGGHEYVSPPGSTNVYRDGELVSTPRGLLRPAERRPAPLSAGSLSPEQLEAADKIRGELRRAPSGKALRARLGRNAPLHKGDGAQAVVGLRDAGFTLIGAEPRGGDRADMTFLNRETGARIEIGWDGQKVGHVRWLPDPEPSMRRQQSKGAPRSWREHQMDALAWADEIGARHGAVVSVPSISVDQALADHAGRHEWAGDVHVGTETPDDVEAAARARADGRALTESEKRGVWSSAWVTVHEISHGVNPIDEEDFDGANANLEEALAEESAHVLAAEHLARQGQDDVLRWRERNRDAVPVRGVYVQERHALGVLFDQAGVKSPAERRALVEKLSFETPPALRMDVLAELLREAHPDRSFADWRQHVQQTMEVRPSVPPAEIAPVVSFARKPPALQSAVPGAELAGGGATLRLADGRTRRFEKLPVIPEAAGLTDGSAIAAYGAGEEATSTLRRSDGSAKNFRYVEDEQRAREVLRAWAGRTAPASPGDEEEQQKSPLNDLLDGHGSVADWLSWLKKKKPEDKGKKSKVGFQPPKPPKPEFIGGTKDAPLATGPVPSYERTRLELGKVAGGSNGARWAFDKKGRRWLVKAYRGDENRIATELLSNTIYRELGAKVARAGTIRVHGKTGLAYPALEGEVRQHIFRDKGPSEEVGRHFMVDALLANWDFAGLTDDNIMWDPEGRPFRVDQGGTLEYRAMGQKKPFGPVPVEAWTMLRKGQGKRAAKVSEDEMRDQAREIAAKLTPERIDGLVDATPFTDEEMRERVRENLKARVGWMHRFAVGEEGLPEPLEGDEFREELAGAQDKFATRPEEQAALARVLEDPAMNGSLRAHEDPKEVPDYQKQSVRRLDGLMRDLKTPEDGFIYVPLTQVPGDGVVGRTFTDPGYVGGSLDTLHMDESPAYMRLLVPAGSHMAFVPSHLEDDAPDDPEVLLRRDSKIKFSGRREVDGKVILDGQVS